MRKLVFSINLSLDGCADHEVALADDELHDFSTAQLDSVDRILFGRVTYQLFESFWPQAAEDPRSTASIVAFANKINAMPKTVFSRSLQVASWNNTCLVRGDMVKEVLRLKQEGGGRLALGGISLIRTFLKLKLIDEYWLLIQPQLWGRGPYLFDGVPDRSGSRLVDTQTFHSGVVALHYLVE